MDIFHLLPPLFMGMQDPTESRRDWEEEWEVAKEKLQERVIRDRGVEQEETFSLTLKEDKLPFTRDLGNMEVIDSIRIDQAI